jgi:hypothetical protein
MKTTALVLKYNMAIWYMLFIVFACSVNMNAQENAQDRSIYNDPTHTLKLKEIGRIKAIHSKEIEASKLSIGFETLDRFLFKPEECYDKLAATGIKWARCQTGWNRCETEKGKYTFEWLDDVVDNLLERGIQPWFNVTYGNKIYMPEAFGEAAVGWVPIYFGEETQKAWENFIRALAGHFKGRVVHYEIWNEANGSGFWQPGKPNPHEYHKLIADCSKIIKDIDPKAKIGANVSGHISQYLVDLILAGVGSSIDFFAIHPYQVIPERNYVNAVKSIRALFDHNGGKHVQLWQGECGYASYFHEGSNFMRAWHPSNESQHAKWLLRRYFIDLVSGMELTSFFQIADMIERQYITSRGPQVPPLHGLLHGKTYEPKMAYYTAGYFASIFDADTETANLYCALNFDRRVSWQERVSRLDQLSAISYGFIRKGYPLYVYYMPEDIQMEYPGMTGVDFLCLKDASKEIEKPVLLDLLYGRVFLIEDNPNSSRFNNLPITDYPIVITDLEAVKERIEYN